MPATAMHTKHLAPLFTTRELAATREFWTRHLGFGVYFETPEYLGLRCPTNPTVELAFMTPASEEEPQGNADGLLYCLRVEDVDAEAARLAAEGVVLYEEPEDMPWGERRATVLDPSGILVYLCHPIPTSGEFAGLTVR